MMKKKQKAKKQKSGGKIIRDLRKLDGEKCTLVLAPPEVLQDSCNSIVEFLIKKKDYTCFYIALNKPQVALEKIFAQKGINTKRIFYVDCITASVAKPKLEKNVLYVPTHADLPAI